MELSKGITKPIKRVYFTAYEVGTGSRFIPILTEKMYEYPIFRAGKQQINPKIRAGITKIIA